MSYGCGQVTEGVANIIVQSKANSFADMYLLLCLCVIHKWRYHHLNLSYSSQSLMLLSSEVEVRVLSFGEVHHTSCEEERHA